MRKALTLASAVLSLAFLASCGGGGGGASTPTSDGQGPGQTPPGTPVAKILASFFSTNPGYSYYEGTIMSDGTIEWTPVTLTSPVNAQLEYYHEFSDGKVALKANNGYIYLYTPGEAVISLMCDKSVTGADNERVYLPHFVIEDENGDDDVEWVVTAKGCVDFRGNKHNLLYAGKDYVVIASGSNAHIVDKNGNKTTLDINATPVIYDREGDNVLLGASGTGQVYLIKEDGSYVHITSDGNLDNVEEGKIRKVGSDFYVAIKHDSIDGDTIANNISYYRISGNEVTPIVTNRNVYFGDASFGLDGAGNLYYVSDCNPPPSGGGDHEFRFVNTNGTSSVCLT